MTLKIRMILLLCFLQICRIDGKEINLALYRTTCHSSSADDDKCGHLAVDGSLDTYWESKPGNDQWLTIDLGSLYVINDLTIRWGTNFATAFDLKALRDINDEGILIKSLKANIDTINTLDLMGNEVRIIRILINHVIDVSNGCIIKEIEINGEGPDRFKRTVAHRLTPGSLTLTGNIWKIQNSIFVEESPGEISSEDFDDKDWIPATVPGTIMGSYHEFGALPDPLYGDNMHQISDGFFSGNDFWYRTVVELPDIKDKRRIFLNFRGINWKADIYFNSAYLGRIEGAYRRAEFDVTDLLSRSGVNSVAVLIYHPQNWRPGEKKVTRKYIGAPTKNGDLHGYDSPAILASAGWNWLPIIRGRNTGIWQEAGFETRGNVSISDPWVSSFPDLPDTCSADIKIQADLKSLGKKRVKGLLVAKTNEFTIEVPVVLNPLETRTVVLDKSNHKNLTITNPKLWWPNGYGEQNLYDLELSFIEKGSVSERRNIKFGIRQLDTKVIDNILYFFCNGQKILLRGGNWGLPEAMIRCDSAGYDLRVRLHRDANFNMIRNWVGMTGHEAFYDACDRYGILIWDDFWLANPVDGPDPKDNGMFMDNVRDKIKWVRKHPSLALYCGRNEGYPPAFLDSAMHSETNILDGTRLYIPHSSEGTVTGLGPYDIREPKWYFANRGITLHSELGIVAFPEFESLSRMMPENYLWPVNNMWAYHDYQWGRSEKFTDRISARYGAPSDAKDYARRAQLLNYESAKAMFESLQSNQGSGLLLWMSQSAWPSMICQLYDHYFEYTSAFFAVKKACKQVHVFHDILKNEIRASNNTGDVIKGATARAFIYDLNGTLLWERSASQDLNPSSAVTFFKPVNIMSSKVRFMKLELAVDGNIISDNFYWLENENGNCLDLNGLERSDLSVNASASNNKGISGIEITIRNLSGHISLLNRIRLADKNTGSSILPVFLSDNYFSLLPGEEKTIFLEVNDELLEGLDPEIWTEGWNTERIITLITGI